MIKLVHHEMVINSKFLEVPRSYYQRHLNASRVKRIAAEFDERIANAPKVSYRDGHYYVFDGQHTIAARKLLNNNSDLNIVCKVYSGLTEQEEALLFAQQTGISAPLTAGAKLRAKIGEFRRDHPIDSLIDNIISPVRQRMNQDQNTVRHMASLLDGVLIEFAIASLAESRKKAGKDALLIGWECDDRTHLWLEAARLAQKGWHIDVLAEPIDSPRPELFPGQKIFVWTGKSPTPRQQEQLDHWREQGFAVSFHH